MYMVMNYDTYKNDGWGLSKLGFQEIFKIISSITKDNIRILEFGSGISTKFFSDLSSILNKKIEVTSFDNNFDFMYKNNTNPNVRVLLRNLLKTDDISFNKMFEDKLYNPNLMQLATSDDDYKNMFYKLEDNDLNEYYDFMLLDGPHGNGRSLAFLITKKHLTSDSIVFIDDFTHYDFVDRFLQIFNADEIFRNVKGNVDKWNNGGDFIIFKIK